MWRSPARNATAHSYKAVRLTVAVNGECLAAWCRYVKLTAAEAEAQWQHQFEAAAQKSEKGSNAKGGWRVRELVLIGGLVLPIWGMVEQALVKQHRPTDRRMHVLRLQTTGGSLLCWPLSPCAIDKLCRTASCTLCSSLLVMQCFAIVFCSALLRSVLFCFVLFCQPHEVVCCTVVSQAEAYLCIAFAGDNAKRLVGMLLPRGAVEDLLKELHDQQAAAEAQQLQQAQQIQAPQLQSYHGLHTQSSISQAADHTFRGADGMQQLTDFHPRLHTSFASSTLAGPDNRAYSRHTTGL